MIYNTICISNFQRLLSILCHPLIILLDHCALQKVGPSGKTQEISLVLQGAPYVLGQAIMPSVLFSVKILKLSQSEMKEVSIYNAFV